MTDYINSRRARDNNKKQNVLNKLINTHARSTIHNYITSSSQALIKALIKGREKEKEKHTRSQRANPKFFPIVRR